MTKRNMLTAAVILAAVALIGLILFLGGRKTREELFTGGEDTPYPYAWTAEKDGTLLVRPCGDIPEGFAWAVTELDESVIAAAAEQTADGLQAFRLTPAGAGDCFFILALIGGEDGEEELCRLIMTVEVTGTKKPRAAVIGHRAEVTEGILRGGEDFGAPYRVWTGENGSLELRLTDAEGAEDWKLSVKTPSSVGSAGFRAEGGKVTAELYPVTSGEAAFILYSASRGLSLEVSGWANGAEELRASTHVMLRHPEWSGREEGYADADVAAGTMTLPEGAEDVRYAVGSLGAGIGAVSRAEFRYLGFDWTLYIAASGGFGDRLEKEFREEELKTFFIPAGLLVAAFGEDAVVAWCDTEERGYLLEGAGAGIGREALMQTASEVMNSDADASNEETAAEDAANEGTENEERNDS